MVVNSPLIIPYCFGGVAFGGPSYIDSQDDLWNIGRGWCLYHLNFGNSVVEFERTIPENILQHLKYKQ